MQERECGDCNMCCKLYSIHEPKDFKKDMNGANIVKLVLDVKYMNQDQNNVRTFNVDGLWV